MMLREADPIWAREEFFPKLDQILNDFEIGNISVDEAISRTAEILTEVETMAGLSITDPSSAFEWWYLIQTIQNMLLDLRNHII